MFYTPLIFSSKNIKWPQQNNVAVILIFLLLAPAVSSCRMSRDISSINFRELARASLILGFDIEENDNHQLYLEAAQWIGVPYKMAGTTKSGVDCSGLTCSLYAKIYDCRLSRSSKEQYSRDCVRTVSRKQLQPGDLVFFSSSGLSVEEIDHVGLYLKEGWFIHASSSRGVVVDNLATPYWSQKLVKCGRPQR